MRPWDEIFADYWEKKPGSWAQAVVGSFGDERHMFESLLNRVTDPRYARILPLKCYVGDSAQAVDIPSASPRAEALRPLPEDGTLRGYVERLVKQTGEEDIGFIVNHVHALHPAIWQRCAAVLDEALSVLPLPSGGLLTSAFFGTYRKTQIGIHKDAQNVFVIPVGGTKRFLLWENEALFEHPKVKKLGDEARRAKVRIPGLLPSDVMDLAQVIDVGPGDLLYIPKGYWHVAAPVDPFAASFHLGLFSHETPLIDPGFPAEGDGFRDGVDRDAARSGTLEPSLLAFWSAFGLQAPPPRVETKAPEDGPLKFVAPHTVATTPAGDVFVFGRRLRVAPPLGPALARALSGEAFRPSELGSDPELRRVLAELASVSAFRAA